MILKSGPTVLGSGAGIRMSCPTSNWFGLASWLADTSTSTGTPKDCDMYPSVSPGCTKYCVPPVARVGCVWGASGVGLMAGWLGSRVGGRVGGATAAPWGVASWPGSSTASTVGEKARVVGKLQARAAKSRTSKIVRGIRITFKKGNNGSLPLSLVFAQVQYAGQLFRVRIIAHSRELGRIERTAIRRRAMKAYDYLIVGGGMTAASAVECIREKDEEGTIAVLSAEAN